MARTLSPIVEQTPIVNDRGGILTFFRLRWQELIDGWNAVPALGTLQQTGLTAALGTTTILTVTDAGLYRLTYAIRKTIADGAASSLTVTLAWTDADGGAMTTSFAALTTDTVGAFQGGSILVRSAVANLTISVAYSSTTPNKMTYNVDALAERIV